jgi:hypothetical protein
MRKATIVVLVAMLALAGGCAPKVGSDAWCEDMNEKPKGDWSANEATDYAKNCLFEDDEDDKAEE